MKSILKAALLYAWLPTLLVLIVLLAVNDFRLFAQILSTLLMLFICCAVAHTGHDIGLDLIGWWKERKEKS